ncbi:xkdF (plasmid) [Bacillus thuringiensis serovar tolworthi]|uniref:XkdF n=1 Tax=Bacillus thuringiensis subsp. tolworthi TaxID=1442 RepID=A0A9W4A1E7_BACTO|nr:hypothetical protein [Bacillus thuringiensis]BAR87855.1 xkdF [Bacillus thuringiensis serovar tolworthi]
MSWNNDIFSDFLTLIFLAWFFSEMLAVPLEPITKRLENIENAASIRKGLDPDEEVTPGQQPIKKSVFSNLNL